MPSDLARYFVQHPSISTKETCKACLSHLEGKKLDLQRDQHLKRHQKQAELLKKDAQIKRSYWKVGTKGQRIRHLSNCTYQTRRVREEAQVKRDKKASSGTSPGEEDTPGPTSHFKVVRENARTRRQNPRPSRASSSTATSYREDTDDEAFKEMIATGEHAKYLADLKYEQEREERRKKRELLDAERKKDEVESEDEPADYRSYFSNSRSASPI